MALPTQKEIDDAKRAELFLDFGDAPEDPSDEPEHAPTELHHTDKMPPGSGNFDWGTIRAGLIQHRISKGRSADGTKVARVRVESDEDAVTIIEPSYLVGFLELPVSPRNIMKRADARGWQIASSRTVTHRAAVLYQADSKEGDSGEHQRGDVRYPAEDRTHFLGQAILMNGADLFAFFSITYQQRDGKNAFEFARMYDKVSGFGIARSAGEFEEWFGILAPKPQTKKKATEQDLLEGDVWNG